MILHLADAQSAEILLVMVRRCTYRAPPSGIQGDHRDDLVEEEDGNSDEDDVGPV